MIKISETEVVGWQHAIRGMRNPLNSWEKSDSDICYAIPDACQSCDYQTETELSGDRIGFCLSDNGKWIIGPNDYKLMMNLRRAGSDHRKYMRMIVVYCDIEAPLYWWKEFDTYKVGTVANSCSTMHKIHAKPFELDDFAHEHLNSFNLNLLKENIRALNAYRNHFLVDKDKDNWWQMIQLLGSAYIQKRTVMMSYEVLANMHKSRKNHKLDEWREFCDWIETLPYSEIITGKEE